MHITTQQLFVYLKRLVLLLVVSIVFWNYLFLASAQTKAATQPITVATFNTQQGTPNGKCDQEANPKRAAKIKPIARYIQSKNIDVILLQEMILFEQCDDFSEEVEALARELTTIGYKMEYATVPQSVDKAFMRAATFSRFPIVHSEITYIDDLPSEHARTFLVTPIITPLGKINFYNAHVRHTSPQKCPGYKKLLVTALNDANPLRVVGGDMNLNATQDLCGIKASESFHIGVHRDAIDFLLLPKNGPLYFEQSWSDPGSPASDHDAVFGRINTTNPPTPTPTPTPSICGIQGLKVMGKGSTAKSIESDNLLVTQSKISIDGITKDDTNTQPYFATVNPGQHSVTFTNPNPTQYDVGYTLCQNKTDCHLAEPTMNTTTSLACPEGYVDLWWHFIPKRKPGDITGDGKVDIFDFNKVIEYFGQDKCDANLVETCKIDIFDFNQVLTHFGS